MPKPVQAGASALELARAYGVKGKLGLQLDEVVVPVHILGSLEDDRGRACIGGNERIPALGSRSNVGLHNPADSGTLAVLETIWAHTIAGTNLIVARELADVTGPFAEEFRGHLRDDRQTHEVITPRRAVSTIVTVDSAGVLPLEAITWAVIAPHETPIQLRAWLSPGTTIWVGGPDVDDTTRANFTWVEFPIRAEDSSS